MQENLVPAFLFVAASWLAFLGLRRLLGQRRAGAERWAADVPDAEETAPPQTPHPGSALPLTALGQADLRQALRQAGYYHPTAVWDYALLRAALVVVPLLIDGGLALVVPTGRVRLVLLAGAAASVLGFSLPRLYLVWRGRSRARRIEKGLPFAVDLLSLALSAGQNTLSALRLVGRELKLAHPVLAAELEIVNEQAKLSSVAHALGQMADRVAVPDVRNLALLVGQSERLGADISAALLEFSRRQRTDMRQRAEGQANRASFWMTFPSVGCLWVAGALILVGPMYVQFRQGWARMAEQTSSTRLTVERANQARDALAPARPSSTPQPTLP